MRAKLAVLDGTYLVRRSYHASVNSKEPSAPMGGVRGIVHYVHVVLEQFPSVTRCVVAFDGGRSSRRKTIYEDYKRRDIPEEKRKEDDALRAEMARQVSLAKDLLVSLGCIPLQFSGVEGDDLMYHVSRVKYPTVVSVLVSDDRDFMQMLRYPSIMLYQPTSGAVHCHGDDSDLPWDWVLPYRAIVGDSSDNIDGIRGAGEVTALKVIQEAIKLEEPDKISAIIQAARQLEYTGVKGKRLKKFSSIVEGRATLERNVKLMDLSEEKLPEFAAKAVDESLSGTRNLCEDLAKALLQDVSFSVNDWKYFISKFYRLR